MPLALKRKASLWADRIRGAVEFPVRRILNRNRPRIFLFADSRGVDVTKPLKRGNPYGSYAHELLKRYHVDFVLLPAKHTTIADFFRSYEATSQDFDAVVVHAMAVDVAPRPKSSVLNDLYQLKKADYDAIFGEEAMAEHLSGDLGVEFEGEMTHNAFSTDMAVRSLVPKLKAIPNLVFIGSNPLLTDWRGNYWKDRPSNCEVIPECSHQVCAALPNAIDIAGWSDEEIKKYTCDNVHFTPAGMRWLAEQVTQSLESILG